MNSTVNCFTKVICRYFTSSNYEKNKLVPVYDVFNDEKVAYFSVYVGKKINDLRL